MSEQKNRLDLIDLNDYPVSWWLKLLDLGHKIVQDPAAYSEACKGKIMGTLFYEPSTRTQMSFQTAMLRLGGTIIGFDNPATSSVAKGENIKDTTKIVSGYADIMMNGLVHPTDMGRFSGKIYQEAQRLITLVGDIIRLSQLDEEKVQMEKRPVDLHMLASDVVKRLQDVARKNQITLMLTGKPTVVNGNPQILDEMIYNLCDNAIKYNKPFGEVEVNVVTVKDHPVLTVEDDGIGIPIDDQERIFERFYRVDKSHSRQIGGTGLGLSIVKHGAIYHKAKV